MLKSLFCHENCAGAVRYGAVQFGSVIAYLGLDPGLLEGRTNKLSITPRGCENVNGIFAIISRF